MSDLDRYLLAEDQAAIDAGEAEQRAYCWWGKHYVLRHSMGLKELFWCKACEAGFEANCAEVEELRKGFGGE